jgi:energy-coupling factor transporter ATP-binding protein EcfA2
MKLKTIYYNQFAGQPEEWRLSEVSLKNTNLIVGRNASGKTRTLNIVKGLAELLSTKQPLRFLSGDYNALFEDGKNQTTYILKYEEGKVLEEKVSIDDKPVLTRDRDGSGKILAVEIGKNIGFQVPVNEVAACAKRDSFQHPFLDPLIEWGKSLIHFDFGTDLGKEMFQTLNDKEDVDKIDDQTLLSNTNNVLMVFRKGRQKFGKDFVEAIMRDMKAIDFNIKNIVIGAPTSVVFTGLMERVVCLFVEEEELKTRIDQANMSRGMFRALSVIIQVNYILRTKTSQCVLIDDIGEGLDYERSSGLVKLLIKKAEKSGVQLSMATNDRFIMNSVPLEYWSIVYRHGSTCKILNRENSPKVFEDFELTGLGNFDFFSSGYYLRDGEK